MRNGFVGGALGGLRQAAQHGLGGVGLAALHGGQPGGAVVEVAGDLAAFGGVGGCFSHF